MTATLLTEVLPTSGETVAVGEESLRDWLSRRYARAGDAYTRLNMITSLTGSATGADGTSETLTSRVDRAILGVIRRDADVVLVGAQSVRAEGYVVPRSARLAVVTTSGDLDGHRLEGVEPGRVLLVCPASHEATVRDAARRLGADVVAVASAGDRLAPRDIVAALAGRGLGRIVCEGGPTLASAFVEAGAIDEICVTSAPVIGPAGEPFVRVDQGAGPRTEVAGMLVDDAGFSYLRLTVRPRDRGRSATA